MANTALQAVDLIRADGKLSSGLVPVRNHRGALDIGENAVIFDAQTFERIDYVFFRRFSDGRSSQVSAYVVDNSNERLDEMALANLHLQVWLQGTVPLLYVARPSRVDVLTCARGPDFWNQQAQAPQYNPAKTLQIAAEISDEMRKFSALRLADGTFWEDPNNAKLANHDKAAHQSLIQAVVEADKDLDGKNNPVLRRLLLLMVLVKYLEDRRVFPNDGWFGRFHKGARNFFEVLKGGEPNEVDQLLNFLARKFNGDVFDLSRFADQELTTTNLKTFADLVEAKTLKRQRYLWGQFSFEHLPVEIISHLYQRFVEDGHGAVYTPPFLATLLLDHAMPYGKLSGKERILDPACGSGVFLVGAFRRLINFWRSQHNWQRPTVQTLKKILKSSIYGIDLDTSAIDLSAFSLSLAICDALKPEVIRGELKFDYLRESNLFQKDFFQLLVDARQGSSPIFDKHFDIVVGNPPFESKLTRAAKEIDRAAQQQENSRGKCPDNQAAYLFLEQALTLLLPNRGRVCLIQPVGFLYNRSVNKFRRKIFQNHRVDTVLDFTSIRNLYEADAKTVAVFAHTHRPAKDNWIAHWTFRRTVSVHQRICFELDHYDRHRVLQQDAEDNPYVWRVNLLGGGRLLGISQRLRSMRTLAEHIKQQGWEYGEGFIAARTGRREPAPFLTGKPLLTTSAFSESGIDENKIGKVTATHFRSAYTEDRYSAPLVLIKQVDSLPVVFWDKGFLAYSQSFVGIHAPRSHVSELRKFYNFFHDKHDIYKFACILNSGAFSATAHCKESINELPHPDDLKEYSFSFWEDALCQDVLRYMIEYVRLGQNSELFQKAADINALRKYSSIFVRMLGSVYDNLHAGNPVFLDGLTCQPFYFGDRSELSWLDKDGEVELRKLVYHENHEHLQTIRVFRLYSENTMLIVKPDRLRYWISSTAIRDADETLIDLRRQGY
jgi:hypothetical protein